MIKLLKKSLLFTLFAVFSYIVLVIVFESISPFVAFTKNVNYKIGGNGHLFTRLKEVRETENIDILFTGASLTYRGFDVRTYEKEGYKVFNFGSSAQTPIQTEFLLNNYIDKLNPKIVVLETNPRSFSSDGVESMIDVVSNEKNDFKLIKLALSSKNIKVYNTLIYSLFRELVFDEKNQFEEEIKKSTQTYIKGGFVETEIEYNKNVKPIPKDSKRHEIEQKQKKAFVRIIELLKKKDIQIILLKAPVSSNEYEAYSNQNEFDEMVTNYAPYYNLNERISLNDSLDFYDAHHLNQNGVVKLNKEVLNLLKAN